MTILCQLDELKLSCFGCCGNSYSNKKKLMQDIKKNTLEFNNKKNITQFMTRTHHLKDSGICANLIFKDKKFFCPGHPALHSRRDYRNLDPDCHKDHICKTYGLFQIWTQEKKLKFLNFLKSKKFDSYTYSIKMDDNSMLEDFEKEMKK